MWAAYFSNARRPAARARAWGQNEGLGVLVAGLHLREDRQCERCGLSRSGLRQTHEVAPLQKDGDRGGLDGRRGLVADVLEGLEHSGIQSQIGESELFGGGVRLGGGDGGFGCHDSTVVCSACEREPGSTLNPRADVGAPVFVGQPGVHRRALS